MKKHRCKECIKFCTDDCKYREDVDTMTFVCTSFEDKALCSSCEEGDSRAINYEDYCKDTDSCAIRYDDEFTGVDLEKDKWTK